MTQHAHTGAPPRRIDAEPARTLAATAQGAGVDVTLHVAPEMPHIWPMSYPAFPEAVQAVEEIAGFVHRVTS